MKRVIRQSEQVDALAELHKHLNSCLGCQSAVKASAPYELCNTGLHCILNAAKWYQELYRLRAKAHNRPGGCVYACPDLSAHGMAYTLTAPALIVNGVQDTLL